MYCAKQHHARKLRRGKQTKAPPPSGTNSCGYTRGRYWHCRAPLSYAPLLPKAAVNRPAESPLNPLGGSETHSAEVRQSLCQTCRATTAQDGRTIDQPDRSIDPESADRHEVSSTAPVLSIPPPHVPYYMRDIPRRIDRLTHSAEQPDGHSVIFVVLVIRHEHAAIRPA